MLSEDSEISCQPRPAPHKLSLCKKRASQREYEMEVALGYGGWRCAGQAVVMMELNKVFVEVRPTAPGCGEYLADQAWMPP